jgi:predicted alpha/beta superfamily hydrolase
MGNASWLVGAMCLLGCFAPERPPITGRVERFTLASSTVDETFELFVRLPPEYDADRGRRFPLVVQLDANLPTFREFEVTAGFASKLERDGKAPPAIVAGVGYRTEDEARLERLRDLGLPPENDEFRRGWPSASAGNAPAFYDFLRDELAPHLDATYRLDGRRALFGHSLGGLFVVYAITRHSDAAPLFTGFVAASPALHWDGGQLLERWKAMRPPSTPLQLFIAAGQLEGPEIITFFDEFTFRAQAQPMAPLSITVRKYQVDHIGSVAPSFRDGLEHLFLQGFGP